MVILISRVADEYLWNELFRIGGFDVLRKPLRADEVERAHPGPLLLAQRVCPRGKTRPQKARNRKAREREPGPVNHFRPGSTDRSKVLKSLDGMATKEGMTKDLPRQTLPSRALDTSTVS